jgi:2-oxoglutarate ferredoxin oxidoreductase subunit gamma
MIEALPRRTDLTYIAVPANDIAQEIGNPTVANMVALGALVATSRILPLALVIQAMRDHLPPAKVALLKDNEQALHRGAALVEAIQAQ